MKKTLISMLAAVILAGPIAVAPASAQSRDVRQAERQLERERQDLRDAYRYGDRRDVREESRDLRDAQRDLNRERRQDARDWRQGTRYDWNRPGPGGRYYADRYYRDGRYYQERRLGRGDRIYRGADGRNYCRRPDGTTGLVIGGVAGGLLGNALDGGRSSLLGTLIGAGGGALLGREIERGNVRCR